MTKSSRPKPPQPHLDLASLRTLLAVIDAGSFSGGARLLGRAQGSVSQQIAKLERRLGVRLLDRLRRQVVVTEGGRLLAARARELLALEETGLAELAALEGLQRGQVNVGASTTPAEHLLPALVQRFRQAHPRVSVSVRVAGSTAVCAQVESGQVAFGLVGSSWPHDRLVFEPAWSDRLVAVVGGQHPWRSREQPLGRDDLQGATWVAREAGSGTRAVAEACLASTLGLEPTGFDVAGEFGSAAAVLSAVRAGLGVALVSARSVVDADALGLRLLEVADFSCERQLYLVRDRRRSLSPPAQAFFELLDADSQ